MPVRSGSAFGQWGPADRRTARPARLGDRGRDVGAGRRSVRKPLHAVLHDRRPSTSATARSASATPSARTPPAPTSPRPLPFVCQTSLGGDDRPPRVRERQRTGLHGLEVGPELDAQRRTDPDLEPAPQRRRHATARVAHGDLRAGRGVAATRSSRRRRWCSCRGPTTSSTRAGNFFAPELRHRRGPLRRPARALPRHVERCHCWRRTCKVGDPGRSRSSPTAPGSGWSTRPGSPTCPAPVRRGRSRWHTSASGPTVPYSGGAVPEQRHRRVHLRALRPDRTEREPQHAVQSGVT